MVELPAWEQWQPVWEQELEISGIVNREREHVSTEKALRVHFSPE